jgi:hypothetical protein
VTARQCSYRHTLCTVISVGFARIVIGDEGLAPYRDGVRMHDNFDIV